MDKRAAKITLLGVMSFLEFPEYNASISLAGGQLLSFRDWIFLSPDAVFAPGKAIRGGIPLVFPYFGAHPSDPSAPQHGHARTALWKLESQTRSGATLVWNTENFALQTQFQFSEALEIALQIRNLGPNRARFEAVLHSYFAVSDIESVEIEGLDGAAFFDKFDDFARKISIGTTRISAPTDRVYESCGGPLRVVDAGAGRALRIESVSGWRSTVLWNPFAPLSDLRGEAWRRFVCVESGAVGEMAPEIEGGQSFELSIKISRD